VKLYGRAGAAYDRSMMLRLTVRDFLTLQSARGMAIDVLAGRVWITEDGRAGDSFVDAGRSYRVGGQGLVLIGAENPARAAEVVVRHPAPQAAWAWIRGWLSILPVKFMNRIEARRTRGEIHTLPDHMLRDIGLRRDQIDS
jgi:uncharacterized protein YjiS (DUF1127 family)